MSDEYYDEDGFRLEFEDDTSDQEKQFFMRAFPNVNKIAERKVHCTSCYMHLGTAPITEAIIRMHPVLRVSHCRNCHTFYNSGEFDKGEDGSELYCRWCGQGGEVYCCSKCPYVFCKKCIVQNLSRACVQDISRNDNWQCFSCAPKIMWHLRAQHWALVNYIEKQKKDMKDKNLSVQTINNLMKQDNTTCCSGKGLNKKATTPVSAKKGTKRPSDANDFSPGAAKIPDNKRIAPRPAMPSQQAAATPPSAKKAKTDNNEVVCTPDIMSMFMNPEEPPPLVAARTLPPAAKPPPPKPTPPPAMPMTVPGRQVVVRPAIPATQTPTTMRMPTVANSANTAPPPVYHTINGYRIDLHTAAQQGTYRLPNGKLIQVRKQAPTTPPAPTAVPATRNVAPKPPNAYFNPVSVPQNQNLPVRMTNGGSNMHINIALQQQQQLQEQRLQQQRQQQQQQQQQQQMLQQQRQQQLLIQQAQAGQPQPTIVAGQINPALQLPTLVMLQNMVNGPHEDSPLGKSRKNFEGKLLSGVEICQHIVNKINTLTNSNSFKNIRNVRDLKELYIHVSYLLTYAIGRFKTLQEKCVDDVKKMGFTKESDFVMMGEQISNRNPDEDKSDDEDDCEIVEQNTTCIELDSDDEDDGAAAKKKKDEQEANKSTPQCPKETEAAVAAILQEKDDANSSAEPIAVESVEHLVAEENDSSSKDKSETETATSEENTSKDVVAVDSAESIVEKTNEETNKADDDLVEIIDGDENGDEQATKTSDKAAEDTAQVASKDGDETANNEVVDISETDDVDGEPAQDKTSADKDDAEVVSEEEKQEVIEVQASVEEKSKPAEAEAEKQESTEVQASVEETVNVEEAEAEKQESTEVQPSVEEASNAEDAEPEKQETADASSEEKSKEVEDAEKKSTENESATTEAVDEKKTNEEGDAEMESTESEKTSEEESKQDVTENKENELPEADAAVPETEESVATKNDGDGNDETEQSEKMEVDAQIDDKIESELAAMEEANSNEMEDTPVSIRDEDNDPLAASASEPSLTEEQQPAEAGAETSTSEPEPETVEHQNETSANEVLTEDEHTEPQAVDESSDACDAVESSTTETAVDKTQSDESCAENFQQPEKLLEASVPAIEAAVEDVLSVPTGNDLLAQLEDSFLKLQEMIDSTEEATGESSSEQQQPVEVDQDMAEESTDAAEAPTEQMDVDDEVAPADAAAITEESQEATSDGGSPVADDHQAEEQEERPSLAECNGVLDENGTSDSNGSNGELEQLAGLDGALEVGKMGAASEVESINSPEMISGDY